MQGYQSLSFGGLLPVNKTNRIKKTDIVFDAVALEAFSAKSSSGAENYDRAFVFGVDISALTESKLPANEQEELIKQVFINSQPVFTVALKDQKSDIKFAVCGHCRISEHVTASLAKVEVKDHKSALAPLKVFAASSGDSEVQITLSKEEPKPFIVTNDNTIVVKTVSETAQTQVATVSLQKNDDDKAVVKAGDLIKLESGKLLIAGVCREEMSPGVILRAAGAEKAASSFAQHFIEQFNFLLKNKEITKQATYLPCSKRIEAKETPATVLAQTFPPGTGAASTGTVKTPLLQQQPRSEDDSSCPCCVIS